MAQLSTKVLLLLFFTTTLLHGMNTDKLEYAPKAYKKIEYRGNDFKHHFNINLPNDFKETAQAHAVQYDKIFPGDIHSISITVSDVNYPATEGASEMLAACQKALGNQTVKMDTLLSKKKLDNGNYLFGANSMFSTYRTYTLLIQRGKTAIKAEAFTPIKFEKIALKALTSLTYDATPTLSIPLKTYTHTNLYTLLLPDSTSTKLDTSYNRPEIKHTYKVPRTIVDEIEVTIKNITHLATPLTEDSIAKSLNIWDAKDIDSTVKLSATHYLTYLKPEYENVTIYSCTQSPVGTWLIAKVKGKEEYKKSLEAIAKSFKAIEAKRKPLQLKNMSYSEVSTKRGHENSKDKVSLVRKEYLYNDSLLFSLLMPEAMDTTDEQGELNWKRENISLFSLSTFSGWGYPFAEHMNLEPEDSARLEKEFKDATGNHYIFYKSINGYSEVDVYPLINGKNSVSKVTILAPTALQEVIRAMATSIQAQIKK